MKAYINKISSFDFNTNQKKQKKLKIDLLISLLEKISDKKNDKVREYLDLMMKELSDIDKDELFDSKAYHKYFILLKKEVKDIYGYVPKGSVQEEYMAIGVGMGVAIGAALAISNVIFLAIGIPIGTAIGLTLGASKEKTLEKEGKLY